MTPSSLRTDRFYVGGQWTTPAGTDVLTVVDPATEQPLATVPAGSAADVDTAVAAARGAFEAWSSQPPAERARLLTAAHVPEPVDLVVCDASFIGLAKVLEVPLGFVRHGGRVLALIKPQFEAGRAEVGKGGVVRDPAVWASVLTDVAAGARDAGLHPVSVIRSPITGGDGNVEFLDRAKDTIRRMGENISTTAVEAVLEQHPDVAAAAVVGVPDRIAGHEVLMVVAAPLWVLARPLGAWTWALPRS